MKKLLLSSLCLLLCAANAFALAPNYQIEVIVFQRINSEALDSEQWPLIKPVEPAATSTGITLLDPSQFLMTNTAAKLVRAPHYNIISHIAWQETPDELAQNKTVHLYGGRAYNDSGTQLSDVIENQNAPYDKFSNWELNGTVTVKLDRYFDFNFDLTFAEPLTELSKYSRNSYFSDTTNGLFYFHLLQSRRTKSGELNYIDYPIYGVLVKVFPIKTPKNAAPISAS